MKAAHQMTNEEILSEVLQAEKENGCEDRDRLNQLNWVHIRRTGETVAAALTNRGL